MDNIINLFGESANQATPPFIKIKWHKAFDKIFCHSAELTFFSFDPVDTVKIEISGKIARYNQEKEATGFVNVHKYAYLPAYQDGNIVKVPLNHTSLVDMLELNEWTKNRLGQRNNLKSYASDISWSHDKEQSCIAFNSNPVKSPALLCEKYTDNLLDDEKVTVIINLEHKALDLGLFGAY